MSAAETEDRRIINKALGLLEERMSLVEYTRFLQLIGVSRGDATEELAEGRRELGIDEAYEMFLKKKGHDTSS